LEILFIVLGEQFSVGGNVNGTRNALIYCDITFMRCLCQTIFFRREMAIMAGLLWPAASMRIICARQLKTRIFLLTFAMAYSPPDSFKILAQ
jgi:hypothetical protein